MKIIYQIVAFFQGNNPSLLKRRTSGALSLFSQASADIEEINQIAKSEMEKTNAIIAMLTNKHSELNTLVVENELVQTNIKAILGK